MEALCFAWVVLVVSRRSPRMAGVLVAGVVVECLQGSIRRISGSVNKGFIA